MSQEAFLAKFFYVFLEEKEIENRMEEQAQLHLAAAMTRAQNEAEEKQLSDKQTKKLIKEYQKQVKILFPLICCIKLVEVKIERFVSDSYFFLGACLAF